MYTSLKPISVKERTSSLYQNFIKLYVEPFTNPAILFKIEDDNFSELNFTILIILPKYSKLVHSAFPKHFIDSLKSLALNHMKLKH